MLIPNKQLLFQNFEKLNNDENIEPKEWLIERMALGKNGLLKEWLIERIQGAACPLQ